MEYKKFFRAPKICITLICIGFLIIVALGIFWASKLPRVRITTDKKAYISGEYLKVNIKNYTTDIICFSSCFPYYIEKNAGIWESYPYPQCADENLVQNCIKSGDLKAFQLVLSAPEKGTFRLAVPVCVNCAINNKFREDKWFYSNAFLVK